MEMPARLGFARAALLALLPTAAFFVGPALALFVPDERTTGVLLYNLLPTVLPLGALAIVGLVTYRHTKSVLVTVGLTGLALLLALIGAIALLLALWPAEN
jgi:hypothetical protein